MCPGTPSTYRYIIPAMKVLLRSCTGWVVRTCLKQGHDVVGELQEVDSALVALLAS
jgi:hypothetical protein